MQEIFFRREDADLAQPQVLPCADGIRSEVLWNMLRRYAATCGPNPDGETTNSTLELASVVYVEYLGSKVAGRR